MNYLRFTFQETNVDQYIPTCLSQIGNSQLSTVCAGAASANNPNQR